MVKRISGEKKMILREFVSYLIALEASDSEAPLQFQHVDNAGNGATAKSLALVDAKVVNGVATIRLADPVDLER
jgi:hypothetical protein